jgi:uncharacterized membrane protein YtjA (UPF0391 family)
MLPNAVRHSLRPSLRLACPFGGVQFHAEKSILVGNASRPSSFQPHNQSVEARPMLKWALIFLLISVVAGILGFSGIAAGAAVIAKVLFGITLAIFLIFVVLAIMAGEALF